MLRMLCSGALTQLIISFYSSWRSSLGMQVRVWTKCFNGWPYFAQPLDELHLRLLVLCNLRKPLIMLCLYLTGGDERFSQWWTPVRRFFFLGFRQTLYFSPPQYISHAIPLSSIELGIIHRPLSMCFLVVLLYQDWTRESRRFVLKKVQSYSNIPVKGHNGVHL